MLAPGPPALAHTQSNLGVLDRRRAWQRLLLRCPGMTQTGWLLPRMQCKHGFARAAAASSLCCFCLLPGTIPSSASHTSCTQAPFGGLFSCQTHGLLRSLFLTPRFFCLSLSRAPLLGSDCPCVMFTASPPSSTSVTANFDSRHLTIGCGVCDVLVSYCSFHSLLMLIFVVVIIPICFFFLSLLPLLSFFYLSSYPQFPDR